MSVLLDVAALCSVFPSWAVSTDEAPLRALEGHILPLSLRSGHVVSEMMTCPCWCSLALSLRMALHGLEALSPNKAYSESVCGDHFLPCPLNQDAGGDRSISNRCVPWWLSSQTYGLMGTTLIQTTTPSKMELTKLKRHETFLTLQSHFWETIFVREENYIGTHANIFWSMVCIATKAKLHRPK